MRHCQVEKSLDLALLAVVKLGRNGLPPDLLLRPGTDGLKHCNSCKNFEKYQENMRDKNCFHNPIGWRSFNYIFQLNFWCFKDSYLSEHLVFTPTETWYWQKKPTGMFCKKGVLKNFGKFTGKHLCQSLFYLSCTPQPATILKTDSGTAVFLWIYWNS